MTLLKSLLAMGRAADPTDPRVDGFLAAHNRYPTDTELAQAGRDHVTARAAALGLR